jgi:hypothetical protein
MPTASVGMATCPLSLPESAKYSGSFADYNDDADLANYIGGQAFYQAFANHLSLLFYRFSWLRSDRFAV